MVEEDTEEVVDDNDDGDSVEISESPIEADDKNDEDELEEDDELLEMNDKRTTNNDSNEQHTLHNIKKEPPVVMQSASAIENNLPDLQRAIASICSQVLNELGD